MQDKTTTTHLSQVIRGPRSAVYRALLDPQAVQQWMVPDGMTSEVHAFDAREGGEFRISLTYSDVTRTGKTTGHTDTYHGRFLKLVPDTEVVQAAEFETDDPSMTGTMTISYRLSDAGAGTEVKVQHEGLPSGVPPEANDLGWRMSMGKLAALVEDGGG